MPNSLADAISPYLRSHADNPVDWFGWGEEAPVVTGPDHAALAEADVITDRLVFAAFDVLDDAGGAALVAGMIAIEAALAAA